MAPAGINFRKRIKAGTLFIILLLKLILQIDCLFLTPCEKKTFERATCDTFSSRCHLQLKLDNNQDIPKPVFET